MLWKMKIPVYKPNIANARVRYEKEMDNLRERKSIMLDNYEDLIDMTVEECIKWHSELNSINHKLEAMKANIREYKWRC